MCEFTHRFFWTKLRQNSMSKVITEGQCKLWLVSIYPQWGLVLLTGIWWAACAIRSSDCLSVPTDAGNFLSGSHCRKGRQSNCRQIDKQTVRWIPRQTDSRHEICSTSMQVDRIIIQLNDIFLYGDCLCLPLSLELSICMQTCCGFSHYPGFLQRVLHCLKQSL